MYLPTLAQDTSLNTTSKMIQECTHLNIPKDLGPLKLTFYFNRKLFNAFDGSQQLFVEAGIIKVNNYVKTYSEDLLQENSDFPNSLNQSAKENNRFYYPNPTQNKLFILEKAHIELYSIDGKLVAEKHGFFLDVSPHPKGIYMLNIIHGNDKNSSYKVILN